MLESFEQRVCVPSREEQREAVCCRGGFGFQGLWFWGESGDPVPCRKLYVLLSVLLCLLVSGLVVFFLFPHSVLVDDDGIKMVQVWFDKKNSVVILAITVTFSCLCVPNGINSVPSCREGRCRSRFPPSLHPGHVTHQKLQLLLGDGDQPDEPGAVHEHGGGDPADQQRLQHPAAQRQTGIYLPV